jgi:Zn-finger nucleic acid-binding protein
MRICPRCTKILEETTARGVKIEGCHGCGGAWFDKGELTEVAKADPNALITIDGQFLPSPTLLTSADRLMTCPSCLRRLEPFEFKSFPGIEARGCPHCRGVWMDHGELTEIAERLLKRKQPPEA